MPTVIQTYVRPRQGSEVREHVRRDVVPTDLHLDPATQEAAVRWMIEQQERGERVTMRDLCMRFGFRNVDAAKHAVAYGRRRMGLPPVTRRRNGRTEVLTPDGWMVLAVASRRFGVEIEVESIGTRQASAALGAVGIPLTETGWTSHSGRNYAEGDPVRVTTDGSLVNGCEVVLPPVTGAEGVHLMTRTMRALKAAGATAPSTTGFHVHVDANDLSADALVDLVTFWEAAQDAILLTIPRGRRMGTWCRPNTSADLADAARNFRSGLWTAQVRRNGTRGVPSVRTRYVHLNLDAFLNYGTVEFRSHGGTLNAKKAHAWIDLCLAIVEAAHRGILPSIGTDSVRTICADLCRAGLLTSSSVDRITARAVALNGGSSHRIER